MENETRDRPLAYDSEREVTDQEEKIQEEPQEEETGENKAANEVGVDEPVDIGSLSLLYHGKALKTLKRAKRKKQPVDILGVSVDYPGAALENFKTALKIVKRHLPFNKKDVYFTNLPDEKVGMSNEQGIFIDAKTLMYPAVRIAHIIAHEAAHRKGEIENEGLVEAKIRALGFIDNEDKLTEKYDEYLRSFGEFIEKIRGKKSANSMINKIYKLYYRGRYESILNLYRKRYVKKQPKEDHEKAEQFFFKTVFPELQFESEE